MHLVKGGHSGFWGEADQDFVLASFHSDIPGSIAPVVGIQCPYLNTCHIALRGLLQDEYSTVSMQVPTMTTEGNHEVCPACERDSCSCMPFEKGSYPTRL